ncbi:transcriptional regulatory protein CitB [Salmonella enterica subsp. enterica]|uniref:Transcriptional regulatory protein CitB n=1 Tax=Salmonella enterica I TaxID=59201 RepID=A0A447TMX3_SALET|nr:transcriptional regulatory protein CitB [Salmonella enterica subsp. enterica]
MPYLISRPKNKPQNRIADCGEIDENTFNRVRQIFADPQAVHTADTLAQILGSSKTTARRYLEQGREK